MPQRRWSLERNPKAFLAVLGIDLFRKRGVMRAAEVLRAKWVEILSQPGRGAHYEGDLRYITRGPPSRKVHPIPGPRRPGHAVPHDASAPGDPPAVDTGELRNAVQIERLAAGRNVRVGMGGKIGRIGLALEFGVNTAGSKVGPHPGRGADGGPLKILPRPHARPAFDEAMRTGEMTESWKFVQGLKEPNLFGQTGR